MTQALGKLSVIVDVRTPSSSQVETFQIGARNDSRQNRNRSLSSGPRSVRRIRTAALPEILDNGRTRPTAVLRTHLFVRQLCSKSGLDCQIVPPSKRQSTGVRPVIRAILRCSMPFYGRGPCGGCWSRLNTSGWPRFRRPAIFPTGETELPGCAPSPTRWASGGG